MKPLFVDADIQKAETLPTSFYTDLDYFEAAKAKIFEKSWQWIGDMDSLLSPLKTWPLWIFFRRLLTSLWLLFATKTTKLNASQMFARIGEIS